MDNIYKNCAPIVSDRRHFTKYENNRIFNDEIRRINKLTNVHQYRIMMQTNAEDLIKKESNLAEKKNTCVREIKPIDSYPNQERYSYVMEENI